MRLCNSIVSAGTIARWIGAAGMIMSTIQAGEAGLQIEETSYFYTAHAPSPAGDSIVTGFGLATDIVALRELAEPWTFLVEQRGRGLYNSVSIPWQQTPQYNRLKAGIRRSGRTSVTAGTAINQFFNAKSYSPAFMPSYEKLTPHMLNEGSLNLMTRSGEPLEFEGGLTAFNYQYDLTRKSDDSNVPQADADRYRRQHDNDMWGMARLRLNLPAGLSAGLATRLKTDLERSTAYDLHDHHLLLAGSHGGPRSTLLVDWRLSERFVKSAAMHYHGYTTGFTTELAVRPVIKLQRGVFFKGNAQFTFGENLYRQYLELEFHRWWKNNSTFTMTYWNISGGLFPRQSASVAATVYCGDHFAFSPSADIYIGDPRNRGVHRFYREGGGLELLFPLNGSVSLNLGGTFVAYNAHPRFTTNGTIFAGVRAL